MDLLLTLGFYGPAILIALGLLLIIYAEFVLVGSVNIRLTLFALFNALAILWAIFPRMDRFVPPGQRMSPTESPGLFDVIKHVFTVTGQAMPQDVYLVPDVNALVAERDGMMGIGLSLQGWSLTTKPGEDVFLVKDDKCLQPFQVVQKLEKAVLSAEEWERTCSDLDMSRIEF